MAGICVQNGEGHFHENGKLPSICVPCLLRYCCVWCVGMGFFYGLGVLKVFPIFIINAQPE